MSVFSQSKTKVLVRIALLASATAICSQIMLPLPFTSVPINLALLPVFLSGLLLGPVNSSVCMMIYLSLGLVGLPVFSGFRGGPGVLLGPTGGYLIGYVFCAVITGLLAEKARHRSWGVILGMIAGLGICYLFGSGWFMFLTHRPLLDTLFLCVIPFIPGDAFKIIAAAFLSHRLRSLLF